MTQPEQDIKQFLEAMKKENFESAHEKLARISDEDIQKLRETGVKDTILEADSLLFFVIMNYNDLSSDEQEMQLKEFNIAAEHIKMAQEQEGKNFLGARVAEAKEKGNYKSNNTPDDYNSLKFR